MKSVYWRGDIILNTLTHEVGDVQTDNFGLPRRLIPVRVSAFGEKNYTVEWRAEDCLRVGGCWSQAWGALTKLRDNGVYPLTDPRLGLPYELREVVEVA